MSEETVAGVETVVGGDTVVGVDRLVDLRDEPLSIDEAYRAVSDASAGGIAVFVGAVRNQDQGQQVDALSYSAHPSVVAQMRRVADRVVADHDVLRVALLHRVGDLVVGDLAVVTAVSSVHRAEAFAACRAMIDDLKTSVPIWKHQLFADGTDQWVGSP